MDKKQPNFGTRDINIGLGGCATPGLPFIALGFGVFIAFGYGGILGGEIALAILFIGYILHRLFLTVRLRVDPNGLTTGKILHMRFIPWSSINRVEYAGPKEWASIILWIGDERVPVYDDGFRWDVTSMLWRYLRYYTECPPSKRKKSKKPGADSVVPENEQEVGEQD